MMEEEPPTMGPASKIVPDPSEEALLSVALAPAPLAAAIAPASSASLASAIAQAAKDEARLSDEIVQVHKQIAEQHAALTKLECDRTDAKRRRVALGT
jgi:hypothetical protein